MCSLNYSCSVEFLINFIFGLDECICLVKHAYCQGFTIICKLTSIVAFLFLYAWQRHDGKVSKVSNVLILFGVQCLHA